MLQVFANIFSPRGEMKLKNICFAPSWNSSVTPIFFNSDWNWKFHLGAKLHVWRCSYLAFYTGYLSNQQYDLTIFKSGVNMTQKG